MSEKASAVLFLSTIALAGVVVAAASSTIAHAETRSYTFPAGSMLPTIRPGDHVMTQTQGPLCPRFVIRRGEIVVIEHDGSLVFRRVVGLPGDRVRLDDNGLEVNGERITGPVLEEVVEEEQGRSVHYSRADEQFEESLVWSVYFNSSSGWGEQMDVTVPEGSFWGMGDNRGASLDSRRQGPYAMDAVVGVAMYTYDRPVFGTRRDISVYPDASCASS